MARWLLLNSHYLNVPGTEWEQKETDRTTGKQARKVYPVPRLLDPKDPGDQNREGEVIVCWEGKGERSDIVFTGDPTPEMEALDDEAKAITKRCAKNWVHPIEGLPADGGNANYYTQLMERMQAQIEILSHGSRVAVPADPAPTKHIDPSVLEAIQLQLAALTARNAELEARFNEALEPAPE